MGLPTRFTRIRRAAAGVALLPVAAAALAAPGASADPLPSIGDLFSGSAAGEAPPPIGAEPSLPELALTPPPTFVMPSAGSSVPQQDSIEEVESNPLSLGPADGAQDTTPVSSSDDLGLDSGSVLTACVGSAATGSGLLATGSATGSVGVGGSSGSAGLGSAGVGSAGGAAAGSALLATGSVTGSAAVGSAGVGSAAVGNAGTGSAAVGSAGLGSAGIGSAVSGSAATGSAAVGSAATGSGVLTCLLLLPNVTPPNPFLPLRFPPPPGPPSPAQPPPGPIPAPPPAAPAPAPPPPEARTPTVTAPLRVYQRSLAAPESRRVAWNLLQLITVMVIAVLTTARGRISRRRGRSSARR
ncbi:hypothetical protein [Nocardia callitridis]|uniref:hypothetical protein n=1 Tax=Nocardia callitridis TaxID=648753 RepID=UPI0031E58A60